MQEAEVLAFAKYWYGHSFKKQVDGQLPDNNFCSSASRNKRAVGKVAGMRSRGG